MLTDWHRVRLALVGALALALAAGCSARSVDYYKAHRTELARRLDDCIVYGSTTTDCQNARRAYEEANGMNPAHAAGAGGPPSAAPVN